MALQRKKDTYTNKLASFEDQIKKKQMYIARLNEKTYKTSIKTTIIGKDAAKSEYWHFKDDNTRLYIRMEHQVPIEGAEPLNENVEMQQESATEMNGE